MNFIHKRIHDCENWRKEVHSIHWWTKRYCICPESRQRHEFYFWGELNQAKSMTWNDHSTWIFRHWIFIRPHHSNTNEFLHASPEEFQNAKITRQFGFLFKVVLWRKSHLSFLIHFKTETNRLCEKKISFIFKYLISFQRHSNFSNVQIREVMTQSTPQNFDKYDEKRYLNQFVSEMFDSLQ